MVENVLPADTGGESAPQWPERAGLDRQAVKASPDGGAAGTYR